MANAAEVENDGDVALIEEYIETGLTAMLENYRPNYVPGGTTVDVLDDRFRLLTGEPIPELSHAFADAFAAEDLTNASRKVYGMVCTPELPYRAQAIQALQGLSNQYMTLPLAGGAIKCSHLNEQRFVVFFERPTGITLADFLLDAPRIADSKIIDLVLRPICNALTAMREKGVYHGNLHSGLIYLGESTLIGEGFSAPAGTLGHYIYEPLERLMANPLGHGEASEKADMYALGIIIFEMLYGLDKLKSLTRQEFIDRAMRVGAYQVFSQGRDFPESFQDFFRGTLNDNAADRWTLDQLSQFISGKRFNMVAPTPPKDASRPLIFGDESIVSRRVLANSLHRNWREAVKDIRSLRLDRWCELSLHRPELAERIERAMRGGASPTSSERQISDMMMRIFAILDPNGPLRTKSISVRPDGIGMMLCSLIPQKSPELSQLLSMIQTKIAAFWAEQSEIPKNSEMSQAIWQLQRVATYLESRALGFGIERVLYELNPSLPCQSPLLKAYHVTTVQDALLTMDALARSLSANGSLIDRHLAAFIASKIDLSKEIKLSDFTKIPALAENQELIMLWLLSKAQQKVPKLKLVGLCAWGGMRVEKMLDEIHNRVIRKRQKLQLKKFASTGNLKEILLAILNRDVISRDTEGFVHAIAMYDINHKRIEFLQTPLILEYKSRKAGGRMAVRIAYFALMVSGYFFLARLLGI